MIKFKALAIKLKQMIYIYMLFSYWRRILGAILLKIWGRDGIVEETPVHVYYTYLKPTWVLWIKTQGVKSRNNSCIGVTQENSIEFQVQSGLPYILISMVHANYCAPYPKWPWVIHEANMWCSCCMTSLCSSSFHFLLLSLVIGLVTTLSTLWLMWQRDW